MARATFARAVSLPPLYPNRRSDTATEAASRDIRGHTGAAKLRYARCVAEEVREAIAEVVLADAPPGAVIVGLSIAPDGRRAAALTFLPTANYLMDDLYEWVDGTWR